MEVNKFYVRNIPTGYQINTKAASYLTTHRGLIDGHEFGLVYIKDKDSGDKCVVIQLTSTDENVDLEPFDIAVADAVYTLIANDCHAVTVDMIARVMTGKYDRAPSAKKKDRIELSISKMSHLVITIDASEILSFYATNEMQARYSGQFLHIQKAEIKSQNGHDYVAGYIINCVPTLYQFAAACGQIVSYKQSLLTAISLTDTVENVLLKHYVLRRIEAMKNKKNRLISHSISYSWYDSRTKETKGLYADLGFIPSSYKNWEKKRLKIHKNVCSILDDLVAKCYIKEYKLDKRPNSRVCSGVTITI